MVPTRSQDGRRGHARRPFLALFLALFAGCDGERAAVVPEPVQPDPLGNPAYRRAAGVVLLAAEVRLPFHGDPCEPPEGYMVEIVRECLHLHGWELEHVAVTRERAVAGALDGTFDGVLGLTREEGPGLIFPAGDLAVDPVALVVLNDSPWQWTGPASLEGQVVGVAAGSRHTPELDAWLFEYRRDPGRVQWADSRDGQRINLHKLLAGRITVLVDSEEAVFHLARRMGIEAYIRLAGRFDPAKRFSAGFSPATGSGPALAQALDLGLAELRRSGRLALLLETYGLRNGELVP